MSKQTIKYFTIIYDEKKAASSRQDAINKVTKYMHSEFSLCYALAEIWVGDKLVEEIMIS
jgi:hypothetical protein